MPNPESWATRFGKLRSLLTERDLQDIHTHVRLRNWIEHAAHAFAHEFKEQALPYIKAHLHSTGTTPFVPHVESFAALKRIHKLLPFPLFALDELRAATLMCSRSRLVNSHMRSQTSWNSTSRGAPYSATRRRLMHS